MVINIKIFGNVIFLLNTLINVDCKPAYIETMGAECDYEDMGTNSRQVPIILSQKSQSTAFAGKPIYVAPDFNDILDQQTYNVYHEEVHGTILMPRVKFSLNSDDDCMKEKDDYLDYGNAMNGLGSRYLETRARTLRRPSMYNPYRFSRYPMSRVDPNSPVKVDLNGEYNPTLEEMVPYMKRRHTPNTYIVMVDDPVLVVDSVPHCSNETGNSTTTQSAETPTTPTTTAAPARKRRQAPDTDEVLQSVLAGAGGGGGSGKKKRNKRQMPDSDSVLQQAIGGIASAGSGGGSSGGSGKKKRNKRQMDNVLQAVNVFGGDGGSGGKKKKSKRQVDTVLQAVNGIAGSGGSGKRFRSKRQDSDQVLQRWLGGFAGAAGDGAGGGSGKKKRNRRQAPDGDEVLQQAFGGIASAGSAAGSSSGSKKKKNKRQVDSVLQAVNGVAGDSDGGSGSGSGKKGKGGGSGGDSDGLAGGIGRRKKRSLKAYRFTREKRSPTKDSSDTLLEIDMFLEKDISGAQTNGTHLSNVFHGSTTTTRKPDADNHLY